jgi:hypothetical protein
MRLFFRGRLRRLIIRSYCRDELLSMTGENWEELAELVGGAMPRG